MDTYLFNIHLSARMHALTANAFVSDCIMSKARSMLSKEVKFIGHENGVGKIWPWKMGAVTAVKYGGGEIQP